MVVRFAIRTFLECTPAQAWAHATSPDGIAAELAPFVRMTFPAEVRTLDESTVPIGSRLCRSWLLLGGVLPFDYDDVTIVELEPGSRYLERSPMLSIRLWEHERVVDVQDGLTTLTDRLAAEPRVALSAPLVTRVVRALFHHRHRRLARILDGRRTIEL